MKIKSTIDINAMIRSGNCYNEKKTLYYEFSPVGEAIPKVFVCNGYIGLHLWQGGNIWRYIQQMESEGKLTLKKRDKLYSFAEATINKYCGSEGKSCAGTKIKVEGNIKQTMQVFLDTSGGAHLINEKFLKVFKAVFSARTGNKSTDPIVITADSICDGMINAVIMPVRPDASPLIVELDAISEGLKNEYNKR